MKKKPSNIKAVYYTYDIEFNTTSISDDHGETDTNNKIVTIYDRHSEVVNRETLFHEMMHIACDDSFLYVGEKADELEERMIRILSPKIMQMLRDNKELSRYLFFDEEEEYDE